MHSLHWRIGLVASGIISTLDLGHVHKLFRALDSSNAEDARILTALASNTLIETVFAKGHQIVSSGLHRGLVLWISRQICAFGTTVNSTILMTPGIFGPWKHTGTVAHTRIEKAGTTVSHLKIKLVAAYIASGVNRLEYEVLSHTIHCDTEASSKPLLCIVIGSKCSHTEEHILSSAS